MANGTRTPPISAAGTALGLGDMLAGQVSDQTEELRKRRLAEMAGRPDLAGTGYGGSVLGGLGGALNGFGRFR